MKNQMKNDLWTKFKNLYLTSFQLVLFIIALVLIIICIFFYFQLKDDNYNQLSLIVSVFSSIIAALLCSAIINVYEMRRKDAIDNDEKRELANNFTMIKDAIKVVANKSIVKSGIENICTEDQFNVDNGFDTLYQESKIAISILIHGRSFVTKHKDAIVSRFNKEGFETKWFFVDPDNEFIDIASKKTGRSSADIKDLIKKNTQLLIDEYLKSSKLGTLEIYYLKLPPMQAVYIFDTSIVECKYFSSSNKQTSNYVVLYNYDKKESKKEPRSIGNGFYHDYLCMEKESKCVFSSYIHTDKEFKQFLRKKFSSSDFSSSDWKTVHEIPDALDFITIQNRKRKIVIGYRYFNDRSCYEKNSSFCHSQFREKSASVSDALYFIMGTEGTCHEPRNIVVMKYADNKFSTVFAMPSIRLDKFLTKHFK